MPGYLVSLPLLSAALLLWGSPVHTSAQEAPVDASAASASVAEIPSDKATNDAGDMSASVAPVSDTEVALDVEPVLRDLPPLPEFTVEHTMFTLDNGMDVLILPHHKVPAAIHALWYRAGAMDEPVGQSGIAHLFEHLMFKGSEAFPKGTLSEVVAASGGNHNAFTMQDATGYYQYVPTEQLETVMRIEADCMKNLRFTQEDLDTERAVVLQERLMRTENSPAARLYEQMNAALFLHYPYRTPVIGWEHEIKGLTVTQLNDFYAAHYAPDNAVLIVAGDVDAETVKKQAERYYGAITPADTTSDTVIAEEPDIRPADITLTLRDPLAGADKWIRLYTAPGYTGDDTPEDVVTRTHALTVLCYMLAGAEDAPLPGYFVTEQKKAADISCGYSPLGRGPQVFSLSAALPKETSPEDIGRDIDAFLRDKKEMIVTEAWTEEVKRRLIADRIFMLESVRSVAFVYGMSMAIAGDISYPELWQQRIQAVNVNDISAAYDAMFGSGRRAVTGILTSRPISKERNHVK